MPTYIHYLPKAYRDSVALMQISASLKSIAGVEEASAIMATAGNIALLAEVGLIAADTEPRPSDLLVVVRARAEKAARTAFETVESALRTQATNATTGGEVVAAPRSLAMAQAAAPETNLALISVPGDYAAAEGRKALALGLNVMLFSDNVSLADEIALKHDAQSRGLMVMGPDCGTAIVDGVPLGFANRVARGAIGCVGASGTGLQEVTTLVDRFGGGVSQAIGTGGRDLAAEVGGLSMQAGIRALAGDRDTRVIVLISKPPAPEVARTVLAVATKAKKPVVVCFIGADAATIRGRNLHAAGSLEDAARAAAALASGKAPPTRPRKPRPVTPPKLVRGQRYVRGLFSGGTFCYEASLLLGAALGRVWSNAPVRKEDAIADAFASREHTLVDLGDDVFTRGRPHPMIDHGLRNARLLREAADPEVAVIIFDVVLGHGSHPDPAAAMLPTLAAIRKAKRRPIMVAAICGTDADPQNRARQLAAFAKAGVLIAESNAQAALLAARIVKGVKA